MTFTFWVATAFGVSVTYPTANCFLVAALFLILFYVTDLSIADRIASTFKLGSRTMYHQLQ